MADPMTYEETVAKLSAAPHDWMRSDRTEQSALHWMTTLKAQLDELDPETDISGPTDVTEMLSHVDNIAHIKSPLSRIVYRAADEIEALRKKLGNARLWKQRLEFEKARTAEFRVQLAKLVDEVTHVISGGDDPSDKCTECGCAGIGMLRDARTDSIALLKETEPAE